MYMQKAEEKTIFYFDGWMWRKPIGENPTSRVIWIQKSIQSSPQVDDSIGPKAEDLPTRYDPLTADL